MAPIFVFFNLLQVPVGDLVQYKVRRPVLAGESEVPVPNAKVQAAPKLRDSAKFSVVQIVSQNRTCRNPSPILREWTVPIIGTCTLTYLTLVSKEQINLVFTAMRKD